MVKFRTVPYRGVSVGALIRGGTTHLCIRIFIKTVTNTSKITLYVNKRGD